jgi:hypothetical protein
MLIWYEAPERQTRKLACIRPLAVLSQHVYLAFGQVINVIGKLTVQKDFASSPLASIRPRWQGETTVPFAAVNSPTASPKLQVRQTRRQIRRWQIAENYASWGSWGLRLGVWDIISLVIKCSFYTGKTRFQRSSSRALSD